MSKSLTAPTVIPAPRDGEVLRDVVPPCPSWCEVRDHDREDLQDRMHWGPRHYVTDSISTRILSVYASQWAYGGEPTIWISDGDGPDLLGITLEDAERLATALQAAIGEAHS